ncbi:MAG: aminopeptidase P family N-terminal domain-containing protein [Christensenellales bacterium]
MPQYLTGFTGSAGTLIVTMTEAALWVDGRYFIQAAREIEGSGPRLLRSGEPGVPTLREYLTQALPEGGCLGFDGEVINEAMARDLRAALAHKRVRLRMDRDLVGEIWAGRPARSATVGLPAARGAHGLLRGREARALPGGHARPGRGRGDPDRAGRHRLAVQPARA